MPSALRSLHRITGLVATVALAGVLVGFGVMPANAVDDVQPYTPPSVAATLAGDPGPTDDSGALLGDADGTDPGVPTADAAVPRVTVQMAVAVKFTGEYHGAVRMELHPLCYLSGVAIPDREIATSVRLPTFEGHDGTYPLEFDLTLPLGAACDRVGWRTHIEIPYTSLCWRAMPYIRLHDIYTVTDDHPVWQSDLEVSITQQSCPIAAEPAPDPAVVGLPSGTLQPQPDAATEPDAAQLAATGDPLLPAVLAALLLLGPGAAALTLRRRSSGGRA